jgi:hypothetical protein
MTDEIKFLLGKFENKLASFWQLDGEMQWCEDDRFYKMEKRARILSDEVNQARADLVEAIEKMEAA